MSEDIIDVQATPHVTEPEQTEVPQPQHPGVVVLRVTDAEGKVSLQVSPINGLDELAVPTVLKLATKLYQNQLGVE